MENIIKLSSKRTREYWEVPVLYEDEWLLALDKPSRLLTSPDRYDHDRPNLMKLLHADIERGAPWTVARNIRYLSNAHRLDFETSGVLLLAKDKPTLVKLANQFGAEKPEKVYLALAQGSVAEENFTVNAKLSPHQFKPGLMRVDERAGKKSVTRFEVLERFAGYTFLKCLPQTGRTHQIRVHARHRRLTLAGDAKYGGFPLLLSKLKRDYRFKADRPEFPLIDRVALHAERLTIVHPATHASLVIVSPVPKDLTVALKYLRRYANGPASAPIAPQ